MRIQVLVRLKPGVLDVQGKAIEHGIKGLGFEEVNGVRMGKVIEFDLDAPNFESAKNKAETICQKLLVNPIIESYEIKPQAS